MKLKNVKLFGSGSAHGALFYIIGYCAKIRAANMKRNKNVKGIGMDAFMPDYAWGCIKVARVLLRVPQG